jgi:hypothetical protein
MSYNVNVYVNVYVTRFLGIFCKKNYLNSGIFFVKRIFANNAHP